MTAPGGRSVGGFAVHPLVDVAGPIDTTHREAFPAATDEQWAAAQTLDPTAYGPDEVDGPWVLPFRAYVVVGPDGSVTIVDLGVGTDSSPAASWAPGRGRLPEGLTRLGIAPSDVDTVVLTHLHEDHVGWVLGRAGLPLFANAEHVVQATEVRAVAGDRQIVEATTDPLRAADLLREVDGVTRLRDGIDLEPTPGHTPGHQSVWLSSGDDVLLLTGDILVHAVQLVAPSVAYAAEDDPVVAAATRERMYAEARRRGADLATAHLTEPFVALP
jgi:glyoxylase-like metal-dependent hydrolase (beta-lactamase superfamily II)